MKRLLTLILLFSASLSYGQKAYLLGGSAMDQLAIVDKASRKVTWSHQLDPKQECNSLLQRKNGEVAYSYRWGVKLIDKSGEVLFDFNELNPNEEIQSITEIKGGYLVGICGFPARIVELNSKGKLVKEIKYDTKIDAAHGEFRQIRKSKSGTYIIPLLSRESIVEIDKNGVELREIKLGESPFSVLIKRDGKWLAPCGHSGKVFEVNPKDNSKRLLIYNDMIEFGAEIVELKNGNLLLANWLGHNGDLTHPILIEFNKDGEYVGKVDNKIDGVSMVSAVQPLY